VTFVAVDWGTSSFRGWLMSAKGDVLAESRGSEGLLHCAGTGFAPVLRDHLARLGAPEKTPVLICGMAGARQGWVEAPYLHTPTRLDALHEGAVRVDAGQAFGNKDIRILPGIAQSRADCPDVMRGEETQLLGILESGFTGLVCIPGTHSKWVRMEAGAVVAFATYMTGELFALISQHSILSHAVEADAPPAANSQAFREGVATATVVPSGLTASLFRLRAAQLLGFEARGDGADRLSGLLIGSEIADAGARFGQPRSLRLLRSGRLGERYEVALREHGVEVTTDDAEQASRRGLSKAAVHIWGAQF
jgi:2-dehydro-3-deoxygalactonokinase